LRFAFVALGLALAACTPAAKEPAFKPVAISPYLEDVALGDPAAPVTIIEYASTTCGHCKAWHDLILPAVKAAYIDTGKAKLVYRTLPTEPAAVSVAGIAIARCAGKDKFFPVLDDLFAQQEAIFAAASNATGLQEALTAIGAKHGLNADQVRTCIEDPGIRDYLRKVVDEMPKEVDGTPTFLVNGKIIEPPTPEAFGAAIAAAANPAPQEPR
jgi:protein-disulfide isomerase